MADRRRQTQRAEVGEHYTEGARLVGIRIRRKGWSVREAAAHLGMSAPQLQRVIYGDTEPSLRDVFAFEDELDIDVNTFRRPARRPSNAPQPNAS